MQQKIRVTILDDHQSIVDGYLYRLEKFPNLQVVATLAYGEELEPTLEKNPTDVLLLDVGVPTSAANPNPYPILHIIPTLLQSYPNLSILVISMYADRGLIRAVMETGASGYLLKDDQAVIRDLGNVVASVANGGIYFSQNAHKTLLRSGADRHEDLLSKRQREALSLCASYPNSSTADLAKKLSVSNSTVRNLLSGAYIKLGVNNRIAAISMARQLGLITPEPPTIPSTRKQI